MMLSLFLWAMGLSVAYSLLPGPVATETLRAGTLDGGGAALRVRLGALLGSLVWAALALSGTGLVLQRAPVRVTLGGFGSVLLLRMAWRALAHTRRAAPANPAAPNARGQLLAGAALALANPLGIGFWLAVSGQIAAAATSGNWAGQVATFVAGYVCGHLACSVVFAAAITGGRRLAGVGLLRGANAVGGVTLLYFGLHLLASTARPA